MKSEFTPEQMKRILISLLEELDEAKKACDIQTRKLEDSIKERTEDLAQAQMTILRFVKHLQRSKDELERERENLRYILEKSTDGVVVTDKDGIVHFVNPTAEIFLGREKKN